MFILTSISIFTTHSEEPALFGAFTTLFMLSMALIIIGLLQVKEAQKNGESKSWYQQYEVSLGLCALCFLSLFLDIGLFDTLPRTNFLARFEAGTLLLISLLMTFFLFLFMKYRPTYDEETKNTRKKNTVLTQENGDGKFERVDLQRKEKDHKENSADM